MRQIIERSTHFVIAFDFSRTILDEVRDIPGRRFDAQRKQWTAPLSAREQVRALALRYNFRYDNGSVPTVFRNFNYEIPEMRPLGVEIPSDKTERGEDYRKEAQRKIVSQRM